MLKNELYYVYTSDSGKLGRVVKIADKRAYGYNSESKEWEEMPSLIRILFEDTNFEPISKEEAEKLINA